MNATEEDFDSKLQKVSVDLIKDLNDALFKFMRKPDGQGGTRVRSWVRANDVFPATCQVMFEDSYSLNTLLMNLLGAGYVSRAPAAARPASATMD